jgi:hypothetical protein
MAFRIDELKNLKKVQIKLSFRCDKNPIITDAKNYYFTGTDFFTLNKSL